MPPPIKVVRISTHISDLDDHTHRSIAQPCSIEQIEQAISEQLSELNASRIIRDLIQSVPNSHLFNYFFVQKYIRIVYQPNGDVCFELKNAIQMLFINRHCRLTNQVFKKLVEETTFYQTQWKDYLATHPTERLLTLVSLRSMLPRGEFCHRRINVPIISDINDTPQTIQNRSKRLQTISDTPKNNVTITSVIHNRKYFVGKCEFLNSNSDTVHRIYKSYIHHRVECREFKFKQISHDKLFSAFDVKETDVPSVILPDYFIINQGTSDIPNYWIVSKSWLKNNMSADSLAEIRITACMMPEAVGKTLDKLEEPTDDELKTITIQMLDTLLDLSRRNLIHGDIKPHNFIFNKESSDLKLIDTDTLIDRNNYPDQLYDQEKQHTPQFAHPKIRCRSFLKCGFEQDLHCVGMSILYMLSYYRSDQFVDQELAEKLNKSSNNQEREKMIDSQLLLYYGNNPEITKLKQVVYQCLTYARQSLTTETSFVDINAYCQKVEEIKQILLSSE